jgi:hypothetical protein
MTREAAQIHAWLNAHPHEESHKLEACEFLAHRRLVGLNLLHRRICLLQLSKSQGKIQDFNFFTSAATPKDGSGRY